MCPDGFKDGIPFEIWEFDDKNIISLVQHRWRIGSFGQQKEKATAGYLRSLKSLKTK